MFKIIIHAFQMDINCILMFMIIIHVFICILMFKIIIHAFQMDINCILMFMIIIHVFQKDFICILMKYYFIV